MAMKPWPQGGLTPLSVISGFFCPTVNPGRPLHATSSRKPTKQTTDGGLWGVQGPPTSVWSLILFLNGIFGCTLLCRIENKLESWAVSFYITHEGDEGGKHVKWVQHRGRIVGSEVTWGALKDGKGGIDKPSGGVLP